MSASAIVETVDSSSAVTAVAPANPLVALVPSEASDSDHLALDQNQNKQAASTWVHSLRSGQQRSLQMLVNAVAHTRWLEISSRLKKFYIKDRTSPNVS